MAKLAEIMNVSTPVTQGKVRKLQLLDGFTTVIFVLLQKIKTLLMIVIVEKLDQMIQELGFVQIVQMVVNLNHVLRTPIVGLLKKIVLCIIQVLIRVELYMMKIKLFTMIVVMVRLFKMIYYNMNVLRGCMDVQMNQLVTMTPALIYKLRDIVRIRKVVKYFQIGIQINMNVVVKIYLVIVLTQLQVKINLKSLPNLNVVEMRDKIVVLTVQIIG